MPPHQTQWSISASDGRCIDDPYWRDADGDGCAEYQAARTWCSRYGITMQARHNCPDTCRAQICLQRHFDNAARDRSVRLPGLEPLNQYTSAAKSHRVFR